MDRWSTTTSYTGDSTATTAPQGGNASRTITDVLGRTAETRTYGGTTPTDTAYGAATGTPYTRVKYDYTRDGKPSVITGVDDAKWSYTYDLFGREATVTDPDKGSTSTQYTDLDQVALTEDARNAKLLYEYDELGRKTGLWQSEKSDANKLADWTYDTLLKGQPDASTRYVGGAAGKKYKKQVTAYDTLGRATSTDVVLPADDPLVTSGAVTSTLTFGTAYLPDGSVANTKEPGAGGLAAEIVSPKYNPTGLVTELSGTSTYLLGVTYSAIGQVEQLSLGAGAKNTYITNKYEPGTGRLTRSHVTDQTHPYMLQDLNFARDNAGNVLSILDPTTLGGTAEADNQCFAYDAHRRMTEAWTPKSADCAASGRTTANLDGAAPYWTSYTYNSAGQRSTETTHTATGDVTTGYEYKSPAGQPHPLVKTTGAKAATYGYDLAGNTTTRPGTQATQTLAWNSEGELASTTEPAAGTKPALGTGYLYDADGELLIRRATGDGDTVLYLGSTEVRLTVKGTAKTVTGTRYYSAAGQTLAVRTATSGTAGTKLSFLAADHHGTSSIATDATTQAITKRYSTPFGAPRGTKPTSWPDDKAFLGKPADSATGLTHIGAREYDPGIGQFISVDPLLEIDKHQTLNGYSYAGQAPATNSDPTGTCLDPGNGRCQPGDNSGTPDPSFPINSNPLPSTGGTAGTGASSSGVAPGSSGSSSSGSGLPAPVPAPSPGIAPVPGPYGGVFRESGQFLTELSLALCGWVPIAGLGCDAYDISRSADEGDGLGVGLGVAGLLPFGDFGKLGNKFKKLQDAWSAARHIREIDPRDVVDGLRATGRFRCSANLAAATVDIDGMDPMILAAMSGNDRRAGMVPSPGDTHAGYPQRYIPVGKTTDSEAKVFNYLADRMGPPGRGVSGTIRLHTQRPMCDSCSGVMDSFQRDYPDVRVIVTDG
ncbi:hypothetical protein OOK53_10105 [Streptomyces anulatus]|nr:hypothetical protein [Streptomyces anulatus]